MSVHGSAEFLHAVFWESRSDWISGQWAEKGGFALGTSSLIREEAKRQSLAVGTTKGG